MHLLISSKARHILKIHNLPELTYEYSAFEPILSREAFQLHFGKHHQSYVEELNKLIPGTEFEESPLEFIVMKSSGKLFDQAAQHWNHSFYWKSMSPTKVALSKVGSLGSAIDRGFGSQENFKMQFEKLDSSLFGSGWLWLVSSKQGNLSLLLTKDAMNPLRENTTALFACDLWEHSYYVDYRNDRSKYLAEFYKLIDWNFAEKNYRDHILSKTGHHKVYDEYFS